MPDDQGTPDDYDWLYSSGRQRPEDRSQPPPATGPPSPPAPPSPPPSGPPQGYDPDATQAMPVLPDHPDYDDDLEDDELEDSAADTGADSSSDTSADALAPDADAPHTDVNALAPDVNAPHTDVDDVTAVVEHTVPLAAAAGENDDVPAPPPSFGGVYAPPLAPQRHADRPLTRPQPAPPPTAPPARPPAGAPGRPSDAGGRRRKRNWWLRGILFVLVAWLVFLIAVPIWSWHKISKVDAEPDGDRPSDTPGTTYLLVGSDSRDDLTKEQRGDLGTGDAEGQRTDTIILLHVPAGDGPRLLLSIPRDSYVDIPGNGKNKINAAYSIGGPKLLVQTVEKATGVRVDDYVEVGFAGFVDIVDAVGGINVCPETSIDDPKAGGLKMKKGCQEVDGHTALDYSRSRAFPLGDITRAEHQREVITQVGKAAASWQTVVFPWRYWRVNHAAAESLQVGDNVGPIDLTRFAWAMSHTSGSGAKRCVVPYTSLGTSTDVGSVVVWDEKAADALFQAIREDDTASIDCTATGQ